MSDYYFLASNTQLKEISGNNNDIFSRIKRMGKKPSEDNSLPLMINKLNSEDYNDYGVTLRFVYGIEIRIQKKLIEETIEYMHEHLTKADEIELWKIDLNEDLEKGINKKKITKTMLTYDFLISFLKSGGSGRLIVINQFW